MRLLPAIIVAVAIVLAPVIWLFGSRFLLSEDPSAGMAVDSGARIEIELLRSQVEALEQALSVLQQEVSSIPSGPSGGDVGAPYTEDEMAFPDDGENAILDSYAQVVLIANRRDAVNEKLTTATPSFLEGLLGRPREVLTDNCEPMTNEKLKAMLVVEDVGPIKVQMLKPAVDSMRRVFEKVRATDEDLYNRISTAGSLCVRRIRGSQASLSSHAFGLSVDLNIDGHLDTLGDGKTQLGLTILADFFEAEGWIWGAGFGREDSMHFEVSREKLEEWRAAGQI
jgi:D-alanyl-D-alanine carboxypeptidase